MRFLVRFADGTEETRDADSVAVDGHAILLLTGADDDLAVAAVFAVSQLKAVTVQP